MSKDSAQPERDDGPAKAPSSHPDPATLSLFYDGEGAPEFLASIEEHVQTCADCRASVEQLGALSQGLLDLPELQAPPSVIEGLREKLVEEELKRTAPIEAVVVEEASVEGTAETTEARAVVTPMPRWYSSAAAVFFVATLLGAWWWLGQSALREDRQVAKEQAPAALSMDEPRDETKQLAGKKGTGPGRAAFSTLTDEARQGARNDSTTQSLEGAHELILDKGRENSYSAKGEGSDAARTSNRATPKRDGRVVGAQGEAPSPSMVKADSWTDSESSRMIRPRAAGKGSTAGKGTAAGSSGLRRAPSEALSAPARLQEESRSRGGVQRDQPAMPRIVSYYKEGSPNPQAADLFLLVSLAEKGSVDELERGLGSLLRGIVPDEDYEDSLEEGQGTARERTAKEQDGFAAPNFLYSASLTNLRADATELACFEVELDANELAVLPRVLLQAGVTQPPRALSGQEQKRSGSEQDSARYAKSKRDKLEKGTPSDREKASLEPSPSQDGPLPRKDGLESPAPARSPGNTTRVRIILLPRR